MLQTFLCESVTVNGIPILRMAPKENQNKTLPTVFIYHGFFSNKETYQFMGEILVSYGYQVIVPDLPLHGERYQEKDLQADFWRIILQSVREFAKLLKIRMTHFGVDPSKTVLFGSSTGGFISAGIFAQFPRLKGLICVNGSGAWEESERLFREKEGRPPALDEELREIRALDPIHHINETLRPILLQHGLRDSIVPIGSQLYYYEKLMKAYEGKEHLLTFEKIPRMDHYISLGMFESMVLWLNKLFRL